MEIDSREKEKSSFRREQGDKRESARSAAATMGKGMNIMNMMSGKKKVVEEKKVVAEANTKDKKSRITFARKVPGAMDFDDVEESITGQKHRRKKTFVTAGDGTGAGAGAGAGQDQQNVKEKGNRANGRSTGAGTRPQRGKDEGNPNAFITYVVRQFRELFGV